MQAAAALLGWKLFNWGCDRWILATLVQLRMHIELPSDRQISPVQQDSFFNAVRHVSVQSVSHPILSIRQQATWRQAETLGILPPLALAKSLSG